MMRASGVVGASRKIERDAASLEQRRELARFLGRIVDDDARRRRRRRCARSANAVVPIASIGLA